MINKIKLNSFLISLLSIVSIFNISAEIPNNDVLNEFRNKIINENKCEDKCYTLMDSFLIINENFSELRLEFNVSQNNQVVPLFKNNKNNGIYENYLISRVNEKDLSETPILTHKNNDQVYALLNKGRNIILIKKILNNRSEYNIELLDNPLREQVTISENWKKISSSKGIFKYEKIKEEEEKEKEKEKRFDFKNIKMTPFIKVEREFNFSDEWKVRTRAYLLNGESITFKYPLLSGEKVFSDLNIVDNSVEIDLKRNRVFEFDSILEKNNNIKLKSVLPSNIVEDWKVNLSKKYTMEYEGLNIINKYKENIYQPQWLPKKGDELNIKISNIEAFKGEEITLLNGDMIIEKGAEINNISLNLKINSSLNQEHKISFPSNIEVVDFYRDNERLKIIRENENLIINLASGVHTYRFNLKENIKNNLIYKTPNINLNMKGVNNNLTIKMSRGDWILYTGSANLNPHVLFWGILTFVIFLSLIISKIIKKPLDMKDWVLIGIGTSFANVFSFIIFIFAISYFYFKNKNNWIFRGQNILSFIIGIITIFVLIGAIGVGLLSEPNMSIAGFNSNNYRLNWYNDSMDGNYLQTWILSVNVIYYKIFILLWSLWLANSFIKWIRWVWNNSIEENKIYKDNKKQK